MNTKLRFFSIIIVVFIVSGVGLFNSPTDERVRTYKSLDANNIRTYVWGDGMFDRGNMGVAGFNWPKDSNSYAIYVSGLWISSKVSDSIRVSISEYDSRFRPGYFDYETQTPGGANDTLYRIYKVSPQYPNGGLDIDPWVKWPVNQGAPWVDVNNNGIYEPPTDYPVMKGEQNLFCVFNDGYRDSIQSLRATLPLRAEVHMYAYARANSPCADAIHYEWSIINKGRSLWTDFSAGIYSDIDLGTSNNDLAGTDSALGLVYGYNGTPTDPVYGAMPPAVGIVIKSAEGHPNNRADFASRWRCPFDCPIDSLDMYRVLHGLKASGESWINPYTNQATKFAFSGNPVTQSGWRDSLPGERYVIIGSIFGNVPSLDTIQFNTTSFIKRGTSNINSIAELKNCVNSVINISNNAENVPAKFILHQNYPNPFNPSTTIRFEIIESGVVSLKIYDMLGREVKELISARLSPGTYSEEFDSGNLPSGAYFYRLQSGEETKTMKMLLLK
jgi:hypothetical protein